MAQTPFSLLLRRLSSDNLTRYPHHKLSLLLSHGRSIRPFSTSQPSSSDPKPSTLSSRMSFVFDQIDAVEREISDKDQTLQRIRAWRQSRKSRNQNLEPDGNEASVSSEASSAEPKLVELNPNPVDLVERKDGSQVELVHPWPEWIELIERLVQQKYFDVLNNEEDETESEDDKVQESGIDNDSGTVTVAGLDRIKDFEAVQTACFNFGKDRFDILRQDIQILVGFGCPSANNRVTFSGKMLRKHAHLNEGDVCSSCSLRSSCARGFLVPKREDEARTADVMRVLSTFAFDPDQVNGSVENKSLIKQKSVRTVVRKLLRQIVKLSAVPIDPTLPRPVIRRPLPKVKKPPTPPKRRIGRDDVEMKRGDWHCSKCDFLNFAKNTICLQCDANQPKRQLLPGEWECSQCNYLNYRRNMVCFKCECKRPPDDYVEGNMQEKKFGARTNIEKSNVWNFDFDDDESDGADVAAFEYGDSAMRESSLLDREGQGGNYRDFKNGPDKVNRGSKIHEREYLDPDSSRPGIGFDDFDDVDNYEIETPDNPSRKVSVNDLSEDNKYSKYENDEGSENNVLAHTRTRSRSSNEVSKPRSRKYAMSGSEEDDLEFHSKEKHTVHSNQRSSNVANFRQRRGSAGPSDGMRFVSHEVFELGSDVDEDLSRNSVSRQSKGNKFGSGGSAIQSRRNSDDEDSSLSSESDGDDYLLTRRNRSTGGKLEYNRRGNFNGRSIQNSTRDTGIRSNGFNEDLYRSPRASHSYRHSESDNDDSDDDLPSGRNRSRARGGKVESSRRGSFKGRSNTRNSGVGYNGSSKDFNRPHQVSHGYGDSESDDDEPSHRNRSRGGKVESSRRGNFRDSGIGSNGFSGDFGRSYRGSGGNDGRKMNARGSGRGRGRGGFGKRQSGRFIDHNEDFGEIRNSRRIIER